jgi:hypothetical protein
VQLCPRTLFLDYFENEFANPNQAFVIRRSERRRGWCLLRDRPTPDDRFEVDPMMTSPRSGASKLHYGTRTA